MGGQQLGHPLHVPGRAATAQQRVHEPVGPFVQQEVAAIIVARLLVEPEPVVAGISVDKMGQVGRQQAGGLEARLVLDDATRHPPIGMVGGTDVKIVAPLGKGLVEDLRQAADFLAKRQIGIEHQAPRRQFADAGGRDLGVVDTHQRQVRHHLRRGIGRLAVVLGRPRWRGAVGRHGRPQSQAKHRPDASSPIMPRDAQRPTKDRSIAHFPHGL